MGFKDFKQFNKEMDTFPSITTKNTIISYCDAYTELNMGFYDLLVRMDSVNEEVYSALDTDEGNRGKYYKAAYKKLKGLESDYNLECFKDGMRAYENSSIIELLDRPATLIELAEMRRPLIEGSVKPSSKLDKKLLKFVEIVKEYESKIAYLHDWYVSSSRKLSVDKEEIMHSLDYYGNTFFALQNGFHCENAGSEYIVNYNNPPLYDCVIREINEFMNKHPFKKKHNSDTSGRTLTGPDTSALGQAIIEARENRRKQREAEQLVHQLASNIADNLKK